jgi:hypothetical protein
MNVSGSNRYTLNDLRTKINDALLNKEMPDKLYQSMDGTSRMIEAIVKTRGDGWAAQVLDNEGKEMLTPDEQERFTRAFQPYLDSIIEFFKPTSHKDNEIIGGEIKTVAKLMGKSQEYVDNLKKRTLGDVGGPDQIYTQIIDKFGAINSTVNGFASKYGVLRLEKEHDIEPDVRIIPEVARDLIALGAQAITDATVGPQVIVAESIKDFLEEIKVPFRLIVSLIYLFLDVARIVVSTNGSNFGRKVLSITLSLLEFLRGDWKKAILSFVGYYGMTPLLIGQVLKAVLTLFNMLSPELQESMIYGAYDSTKSFIVGILLSIFKITAPESIRLPLIGVLDTIANKKTQLDGSLGAAGLQPRPNYLMPSFQDLNNIQAVITDKAFICSKEFDTLFSTIGESSLLTVILQLVGIPTDKKTIDRKCGDLLNKPYLELLVELSKPTTPAPTVASESALPVPISEPATIIPAVAPESVPLASTSGPKSTTYEAKNPVLTLPSFGRRVIRRQI